MNSSLQFMIMFLCFLTAGALFWEGQRPEAEPAIASTSEEEFIPAQLASLPLLRLSASLSTRLVVDLSDREVHFYEFDKLVTSYPVAIGKDGWETPTGTFLVKEMRKEPAWYQPITGEVIPPGPDNPLGSRWIGFWSDGEDVHQIGFHGSNQESSIGEAVSHGCVRMRNGDIEKMYEQVREGTVVVVRE